MTIELKPCPFCGGEAKISLDHTVEENHAYGCPKCNIWFDTFNSENAEVEWNTRAALATPASDAVQEAARVLLRELFPQDEKWGEFTRGDALKACQDHHISSRQFQSTLRAIAGDRT